VIRLALAQTLPPADEEASLAEALIQLDGAAKAGADLVLFPELFNNGYHLHGNWTRHELASDDPWIRSLVDHATALGIAVAVPFLEHNPGGGPYNAVSVFTRKGERILHYRKVHTCAFDAEGAMTPGDSYPTAVLETVRGSVCLGAMICFDREFPESARMLMLEGAELVLVPNACVMERHRQGLLEARAFENSITLALANYAGPEYRGGSSVVGPIVFGEEGQSLDIVLGRAGEEPQLLVVDVDLDAQRKWTQAEVWGRKWRRPDTYTCDPSRSFWGPGPPSGLVRRHRLPSSPGPGSLRRGRLGRSHRLCPD